MNAPPPIRLPGRQDRTVSEIARTWRELTSGRTKSGRLGRGEKMLVACSGGADSSALVLALCAAGAEIIVGHVVHDLRPEADCIADRDAVATLARVLGVAFVEARVGVSSGTIDGEPAPGARGRNPEGEARRLRYLALARLAVLHSMKFVATGHHAGDQLESMLMGLVRGSGPRGLSGVAPSRALAGGVRLIRPMLNVERAACERLCRDAGWTWREDATNLDTTRLRALLRHRVLPQLREVRSGVEARAASAAALLRDAATLVSDRAQMLERRGVARGTARTWNRADLRPERAIVLGELLRRSARRLGIAGMDRLSHRSITGVVQAIRAPDTDPRAFTMGGIQVRVTAHDVVIDARDTPSTREQ